MEVRPVNDTLNSTIRSSSPATAAQTDEPNAFGIGSANRPEVELSAQARILQQNEQVQQQRRESLENRQAPEQEESVDNGTNNFVRVNSSVGSAQRSNLSTDEATELYRSIEKLL